MPVSELNSQKISAETRNRPMVKVAHLTGSSCQISHVDVGEACRLVIMITSSGNGSFGAQAQEVLTSIQAAIERESCGMRLISQTVFLREASDEPAFRELLHTHYGTDLPVTTFVQQAPCDGAALAVEAWAIGGAVRIERFGRHAIATSYGQARWIRCGDICVPEHPEGVYAQTGVAMQRMRTALISAGTNLDKAVRTWFYLGDITEPEGATQRYKELNRARTDFYKHIHFHSDLLQPDPPQGIYPASTGIGIRGRSLTAGCLAVQTNRKDVRLLALENPQQTPAYAYHAKYSPQSPKFSRAMCLLFGNYATTWVSGTASIVNAESRHIDNPSLQAEQTIDNIERLISTDNFKFHGIRNGGAQLSDLAKVRVYIKRLEDFAAIQAVCQKRFGSVPAIYAVADVCRPELLVEIEGVAFSKLA